MTIAPLSPRPSCRQDSVHLADGKHALTHLFEYCVCQEQLRYRRLGSREWRKLPSDGCTPVQVSADGASLAIVDQNNRVHYKKAIYESVEESHYCWKDLHESSNWRSRWVALPLIGHLSGFLNGWHLYLPDDTVAYAVTNRNVYSRYLTDLAGRHHRVVNCSTLYALPNHGLHLRLYDPFVPQTAEICVPLPRRVGTTFKGVNIDAGGALLAVIGYETKKDKPATLQLYTRMLDFDVLGWHPLIHYGYDKETASLSTHVLPIGEWKRHALPTGTEVTGTLTVLQTGEGNDARELRIEGCNEKGDPGFFRKDLGDEEWTFVPGDRPISPQAFLPATCDLSFEQAVYDWSGSLIVGERTFTASLTDFAPDSLEGNVTLELTGRIYRAFLYRRVDLILAGLFGRDALTFDLVPEEDIPAAGLRRYRPLRIALVPERKKCLRVLGAVRGALSRK